MWTIAACTSSPASAPKSGGDGDSGDGDGDEPVIDVDDPDPLPDVDPEEGFNMWRDEVQPLLASECSSCHMGERFGMASLKRAGEEFTEEETELNYETFLDMISLDNPPYSRLLAKGLPASEPEHVYHGGGVFFEKSDPIYSTVLEWVEVETAIRCRDCGIRAPKAYVGWVEHPEEHWMIEEDPIRLDRGIRNNTKIMLQQINPGTLALIGEPIDFLEDSSLCPVAGDCDYGNPAANHDGTQLAFECRIAVHGEDWLDRAWNICIADIGANGKAENARFLKPESERMAGWTLTRTTPFGIPDDSATTEDFDTIGPYNKHYMRRQRSDRHPAFSPDDGRLYFSSQAPDPRTGDDMVETYHGSFHLKHLVSTDLEGGDARTIIRNEGGTVDFPFFRKNGNVAAHLWNLERMDRHLYAQATADGNMELPVLLGKAQGPNNWGRAFEMVNGLTVGMTGRRRSELANYVPFYADHTVGITGADPDLTGFQGFAIIDSDYHEEIGDYPEGYCPNETTPQQAANTKNCHISKLVLDSSWTPYDFALVAYNPELTYLGIGEGFALTYGLGDDVEERTESARPYFPKKMGVGVYGLDGNVEMLVENRPGTFARHPFWVGKRQPPRIQPTITDESVNWTDLHIANFPVWLSIVLPDNGQGRKADRYELAKRTRSVRILRKVSDNNSCIADNRYIEMSNMPSNGLHPTVLGVVDSTGWEQYLVPQADGGDEWGDVPLREDGSIRVRLPAGQLLWFQGIDEAGFLTAHRERVTTFAPGHTIDTGVKEEYYDAQCNRCHTSIGGASMAESRDLSTLPAIMEFDTLAKANEPTDLNGPNVTRRLLTYRDVVRPIFDAKCVSCHAGESPAGGLSLSDTYSATGNYPADSSWEDVTFNTYRSFLPEAARVPSYNFSVAYSFFLRDDHEDYKAYYADEIASHAPLAELAPWDPGYQNLFLKNYYINSFDRLTAVGRVPKEHGNAKRSYLIEVLEPTLDLDPDRSFTASAHADVNLTEAERRSIQAVLDAGFPYAARCNDVPVPSGPNTSEGWGEGLPQNQY